MSAVLYSFYTLCYLILLYWTGKLFSRTRRAGTFFLGLVIFGLLYDNLILAAGGVLPAGNTLYWLSLPRFILHQLLLPWIMVTALDQAGRAGIAWASKPAARRAVTIGAALLAGVGILTRLVGLLLEPVVLDGVTRYMAVGISGPPIVSIVSILFAGVMGFLIWRRTGWPWILITSILVFIGEGIPVEAFRRLSGSGVEVLFMVAMLLGEERIKSREPEIENREQRAVK